MATETKLTQIQLEILKWASQQGEFGFFDLYHKANLRSVYADFHQLIARGLIADKWVGSPFASNDRYRITDAGRAALGIDTPPVAEIVREVFPGTEAKDDADEYDRVRAQWGLADRENVALRAQMEALTAENAKLRDALESIGGVFHWSLLVDGYLKRYDFYVEMMDFGEWLTNTKEHYQFKETVSKLVGRIDMLKKYTLKPKE